MHCIDDWEKITIFGHEVLRLNPFSHQNRLDLKFRTTMFQRAKKTDFVRNNSVISELGPLVDEQNVVASFNIDCIMELVFHEKFKLCQIYRIRRECTFSLLSKLFEKVWVHSGLLYNIEIGFPLILAPFEQTEQRAKHFNINLSGSNVPVVLYTISCEIVEPAKHEVPWTLKLPPLRWYHLEHAK